MKVLFVSNTYAQLVNAMSLAKTEFYNDDCHLYYSGVLSNCIQSDIIGNYFTTISKMPSIENDNISNKVLRKWYNKINSVFKWKSLIKLFPTDPKQYDVVFLSGVAIRYYLVYYALKAINPTIKLFLYEEGICEYYHLGSKNKNRFLYKYIYGSYAYEEAEKLFVHYPSLVNNVWNQISIQRINDPASIPGLMDDLRELFHLSDVPLTTKRFIFVDQSYFGVKNSDEMERIQNEYLMKTSKIVGHDKIVIKLHPRSVDKKYGGGFEYLPNNYPLELMSYFQNIEDLVFISVSSSALINFKLVYNLEPCVILLYLLFEGGVCATNPAVKDLFYRVQKLYSNNHFYMPGTQNEFQTCLCNL